MRISDEELRGRRIIGADGQVVGEVATVFLDTSAWRVETIQAKLRNDVADRLGSGRSVFRAGMVEIPVRMVQSVGETIVLSVPVDELRQLVPSRDEATPSG